MSKNHQYDEHDDINQFAGEYVPQAGQRPGPEILPPDEDYDLEILEAELTKTKNTGQSIFRMVLRVAAGPHKGKVLERGTLFGRQEAVDRCGGDMITLGIDASAWGKRGKSWSQELIDACVRLKGLRFRGHRKDTKSTGRDGTEKTYSNLYVNAALAGGPAPSSRPVHEHDGASASEIPF